MESDDNHKHQSPIHRYYQYDPKSMIHRTQILDILTVVFDFKVWKNYAN